jgi:hypothetical protein
MQAPRTWIALSKRNFEERSFAGPSGVRGAPGGAAGTRRAAEIDDRRRKAGATEMRRLWNMRQSSVSLFEPDTLLPSQFFAHFKGRNAQVRGEKRLMLAVLEDAVDCYQKYAFARDPRGRELFAEAEEWLFSSDNSWVFAYENICEMLEVNPDYVRRGLQEWRQRARMLLGQGGSASGSSDDRVAG